MNCIDKRPLKVLNGGMTRRLLFSLSALAMLPACQEQVTRITDLADLPVKDEEPPAFSWQTSPLRANAQYILFEANTRNGRRLLQGDYYFLRWYDAEPQKPVRIVMHYTQAGTGTEVKQRVIEYKEPREEAAEHKEHLFFNGEERQKLGDVMTWRIELYCDGELRDARQSYLWE